MKSMIAAVLAAGAILAPPVHGEPPRVTGSVRGDARPATPGNAPPVYPTATERAARAQENLTALRQGTRSVNDLTPQELQDVLDFDRMLRGEGPDQRTFVQQCVDQELSRLGRRPSRLDREVIKLKCR